MRNVKLPVAALALMVGIESAWSATYYAATTGSDSANGSSNTPFASLQYAAGKLVAGDTLIVRPGNYVGFIMGWDFDQNGRSGAPITIMAQPGATITSRNNRTADGINLEGSSWIVIDGFAVTNTGGTITRAGVRSVNNSHVTVRNCKISGMGTWGIFTSHSDYLLIESNDTSKAGSQHGVYVSNACIGPVVRRNISHENYGCGLHFNGDLSMGGSGLISNAVIEANIIYGNGAGGGAGINCDGVQYSTIRNNLLYDNHAGGITLFQIDGAEPSMYNTVVNNTVIQASNGRWCLNINAGSASNTVFNNIFYNNHPYRGSIVIDKTSLPGFKSDCNVVMDRLSSDGESTIVNLSSWRTATGQDAHSLVAAPAQLFVGVSSSNYHLKAGSPALDAGTASLNGKSAPTTDLEGSSRPSGTGYDIGAFEYQALTRRISATTGPNGAITPSGVMTVTDGASQQFNIAPSDYFRIQDVVVDGIPVGPTNQYLFAAVSCDHTISVSFAEIVASNNVPQWWLAQYGWTGNFDEATTNDADKDGLTAWEEYLAGTDPTKASSILKVAAMAPAPAAAGIVLRWPGVTNRFYAVCRATNLLSGFITLSDNIPGITPENIYTDLAANAGPCFYRILARP